MAMTNTEFATAVGCHVTTASRYRNGHRLPGVQLLERIRQVLDVDYDTIFLVWSSGKTAFGAYLRQHVFEDGQAPAEVG